MVILLELSPDFNGGKIKTRKKNNKKQKVEKLIIDGIKLKNKRSIK